MAINLKAKGQQSSSVSLGSEGNDVYVRSTRDGALYAADWKLAAIMEGRGHTVTVGTFSTPAVGGGAGGTVIDIDTPELCIGVPSGTSILPIRIEVQVGLPVGAADDNEVDILVTVDQDKMNASDAGTATAETIYNMNTLRGLGSACYANSEYTATFTDPVHDIDLAHVTKVFEMHSSVGVVWTDLRLLYEPVAPPIINGPAMLLVYWGGTVATSAFCSAQWLEYPSSAFTT